MFFPPLLFRAQFFRMPECVIRVLEINTGGER